MRLGLGRADLGAAALDAGESLRQRAARHRQIHTLVSVSAAPARPWPLSHAGQHQCRRAARCFATPHLPTGRKNFSGPGPPSPVERGMSLPALAKVAASHRQIAAVDRQFHARDVGSFLGSEKEVGVGNLLDAAIAPQRHGLQHARAHLRIGR